MQLRNLIPDTWDEALSAEFEKPYFLELEKKINEEYKNKYIQSIYENNEIYDLFKSSSFSSEIETEEKRNSLIKSKNQRIDEIKAALSVEMLLQFKIGRCHKLKGNRKDQYAMDLVHPYRLVFEKKGNEIPQKLR